MYFDDMITMVKNRIYGWVNHLLVLVENWSHQTCVFLYAPLSFSCLSAAYHHYQAFSFFFSFLWGDTDTHRVFIDSTIPHFCFLEEEGGLGIKSFCDLVEALEQKVW